MMVKHFKCTLVSDIVLNSKLATEGNMTTLDYISGSNFLGIVAAKLYKKLPCADAYSIFHSGEVSFGDATISVCNEISYPVPFDFMMEKGKEKLGENEVYYLQHLLNKDNHPKDKYGFKKQLKQKRTGYFSQSHKIVSNLEKTFAIKSAQDAEERRSKEGAMFGFESLKKGQSFIFSVKFKEDRFIEQVTKALTGQNRIGKSKSAEFGQIDIKVIEKEPEKIESFENGKCSLVYLQSNLCVFDEFGQPTFQPTAKDLGFNGTIDWSKSSVRTYSYSPWNGKRNTTDTQRNCIAAGSMFFIDGKNEGDKLSVGAFQAEGLGRMVVNPVFLSGNPGNAKSTFKLSTINEENKDLSILENPSTTLAKVLKARHNQKEKELALSRAIQEALDLVNTNGKSRKPELEFRKVTSSQWGAIRNYASKTSTIETLEEDLLDKNTGYLTHGVAYGRIWSKNGEKPIKELEIVFEKARKSHDPITFIAKFAAQMAKHENRNTGN